MFLVKQKGQAYSTVNTELKFTNAETILISSVN